MYLRDACATALKYGDMKYEDCPGNIEVPDCYESAEATLKFLEKRNQLITIVLTEGNSPAEQKHIYNYGPVLAALN